MFEDLTAEQLNDRFPAFKLAESYYGIFQKDSGIILASKALTNFQQFARNFGVRIKDREEVLKISYTNSKIIVETNKNRYSSNKLILTLLEVPITGKP